jgi:putative hydrolase of the HAD superfamily
MPARVLVFDFGNVLGFFSHRRAAEQLAAYAPNEVTVKELIEFLFYTDLEPRLETAKVSSDELLTMLRKRFLLSGTDAQLTHAFADMFTPNEEVCQLIPRLRGRHRLALLSNTNDLHYRRFREQFAETLSHFELIITSHEVQLRKPDPRIYRVVEERFGCLARDCLFIDDLPSNIEAARACGWQGIVYEKGDDLVGQLQRMGYEV